MLLMTCYVIGVLVGLIQRPRRKRMFKAEKENAEFLRRNGIVETRDATAPYQDAQGNNLRLVDSNKAKLTFLVVGRRNQRAFIDLDKQGRMVKYTGPVKLYA